MNLYIGNLNYQVTEEDLRELFETAGEVSAVKIINDRETGKSRGFAFVEMPNQNEAENAINNLNGHDLRGREITVSEARPKQAANNNNRNRFRR
jgi:RNA recognition motif-containing protein